MKCPQCTGVMFGLSILSATIVSEDRALTRALISLNITYENYSNLGLLDVPRNVSSDTKILILDHNNFSSLTDQLWTSECLEYSESTSCSPLAELIILDLSDNHIQEISLHFFYGLEQLIFVDLSNNNLRITDKIFANNMLLAFIDISRNNISYIYPETFQNLSGLEELYLNDNNIQVLHQDTFTGLHNLLTLCIQVNNITKIQDHLFRDLKSLKYLKIDYNRIAHIPEHMFKHLENLEQFYASHNKIVHLHPTLFSTAKNLRIVDLSHNSIHKLSRFNFQELLRMANIDLGFNLLESVYLSRIPVSLTTVNNNTVLDLNKEICSGFKEDLPCFIPTSDFDTKDIFHVITFSFNNISEIIFSNDYVSHTLEITRISLAGTPAMVLPIPFIKQEKFITFLDLSETDLSWRNMTLLNEIMQLQHLKTLNISGCFACEYYMLQLVSSIFNPNNIINIECEKQHSCTVHHTSSEIARGLNEPEDSENIIYFHENKYTNFYPCHYFENETIINDTFQNEYYTIFCPETVDCSYVSLSVLPKINSAAFCVLLSHNDITNVEDNYFSKFQNMQYLDLSFNSLYLLSGELFASQYDLIILKLNNNNLVHLNSSTFQNLTNLLILLLHGNRIFSYDPDMLTNMQHLELLMIDFSNLTTFHGKTFENLSSLRVLEIRETNNLAASKHTLNHRHFESLSSLEICKIFGFHVNTSSIGDLFTSDVLREIVFEDGFVPLVTDGTFVNIRNVESIFLIRSKLKHLHMDVFRQLDNLLYLDVSENEVIFLHSKLFESVVQLRYLNMSHNQISCIPLSIFDSLTKLEILDLSYNAIIFFNWEFSFQLLNLMNLDLSENLVGSLNVPVESEGCVQQNTTYNLINSTSSVFLSNKPKFLSLSLQRNCINNIMGNAFIGTPEIRHINLAYNNISDIDDKTFSGTRNLTILCVSFNSLSVINNNLFKKLTYLIWLDLSNNRLKFIEERAFHDLHSLHSLKLGFNRLKTFNFDSLSKENNLQELWLNDNFIISLETTLQLSYLAKLYLFNNNQLMINSLNVFKYMPSLHTFDVSNTTLCNFDMLSFQNISNLRRITLCGKCLAGLTCLHFANLHNLMILNVTAESNTDIFLETHLSWKNITLINCLFEIFNLDYLILTGHPICNNPQWIQIIENLFLSEKWKTVICSSEQEVPNFIVKQDGMSAFFFDAPKYHQIN